MTLQPCPNEECRGECELKHEDLTDTPWGMMRNYWAECNAERGESCCGYRGPFAQSPEQAIYLHNRMPRTETWVSVAERLPELGMRCELIHSDPTEPVLVLTIAESEFAAYDNGFESLGALSRGIYTHWRPYREPPRHHTPPRGPVRG